MKKYFYIIICCFLFFSIKSIAIASIITGAAQLPAYLPKLLNKRIAVIANQASVIDEKTHLIDALLANGVTVIKIFTPEHGFLGNHDPGQPVEDEMLKEKAIQIHSLYGSSFRLTAADLVDVDMVVFDLQDVGVRFFTYISTLHYVMEACASYHKPLLILDRPNPNAHYVDGPVLEKGLKSFIGMHPIPIVYGLTIGELARMINGEGWLGQDLKCALEIIPLQNYDHQTKCHLPIPPSPNLTNAQAIALYPSLGLLEGTIMSLGRGTDFPFQVIGYPNKHFGQFTFQPTCKPGAASHPKYQNQICYGIDLQKALPTNYLNLDYLLHFYNIAQAYNIPFFDDKSFDNHIGTTILRQQIMVGFSKESIRGSWQQDIKKYLALRKKYLIYP